MDKKLRLYYMKDLIIDYRTSESLPEYQKKLLLEIKLAFKNRHNLKVDNWGYPVL